MTLHLLAGRRRPPRSSPRARTTRARSSPTWPRCWRSSTGVRDLSWLMTAASAALSLVFMVASMALARRIGGRAAALATGLYLALGPKFLTTFSLNCVGQYVDVLALGGVALALLARDARRGRRAAAPLAAPTSRSASCWGRRSGSSRSRSRTRRSCCSRWPCAARPGGTRGRCWFRSASRWARCRCCSGTRSTAGTRARSWAAARRWARRRRRCRASPAARFGIAFPILAGLSPGHPWQDVPLVPLAAAVLLPGLLVAFVALRFACPARVGRPPPAAGGSAAAAADGRVPAVRLGGGSRQGLRAAALPAARDGRRGGPCSASWSAGSGRARGRPRRSRWPRVLAFNVAGMLPRLRESASDRRVVPAAGARRRGEGDTNRLRGLLDRGARHHVHVGAGPALVGARAHAGLRVGSARVARRASRGRTRSCCGRRTTRRRSPTGSPRTA